MPPPIVGIGRVNGGAGVGGRLVKDGDKMEGVEGGGCCCICCCIRIGWGVGRGIGGAMGGAKCCKFCMKSCASYGLGLGIGSGEELFICCGGGKYPVGFSGCGVG